MMRLDLFRMAAMARKEALQLRRDPRSLVLAFAVPVIMVLFFGYAITWDVKDIRLALWDLDATARSRETVEALEGSGYFSVVERVGSYREVEEALASGRARAALVIPTGFASALAAGQRAPVQLLLDGADANTGTIAQNYAEATFARRSQELLAQGRELPALVRGEIRVWYNETLESRNMIVPGLVAVIMSIIAAMLTSLTIAREWERGTMEQLASTPVGGLEIVLGKLLPYLLIGFFDVAMVVTLGITVFGVPFRGSMLLLAAMSLLFLLGALGLGIFISAVAGSQLLAMQIAMVATYLPALLLSGFLFDIAGMPLLLRAFTFLVPARYYVAVIRGVLLKGVGAAVLWPQALFMVLFAVVGLTLATRVFRKEIRA
jgi:ABC-2 type transport system permease protein